MISSRIVDESVRNNLEANSVSMNPRYIKVKLNIKYVWVYVPGSESFKMVHNIL